MSCSKVNKYMNITKSNELNNSTKTNTNHGDVENKNLSVPEPSPTTNNLPYLWDLAREKFIEDSKQRDEFGLNKYGTRLQPFNGRNPLVDAFQEHLDNTVYLYQALFEEEFKKPILDAAMEWFTALKSEDSQELSKKEYKLYKAVEIFKEKSGQ